MSERVLFHYINTPKQTNMHDCGIFVLHFAEVMMKDGGGILKSFFRWGRQREPFDPQAWREEDLRRGRSEWQQRIIDLPPSQYPYRAQIAEKRVRFAERGASRL